jgi:hypothetical protein
MNEDIAFVDEIERSDLEVILYDVMLPHDEVV